MRRCLDSVRQLSGCEHIKTLAELEDAINGLPNDCPLTKRSLQTLLEASGDSIEDVRESVEQWFNTSMDRASGWFKRTNTIWSLGVAAAISLTLNIDTFQFGRELWYNDDLRSQMMTLSEEYLRDNPSGPGISASDGNQTETPDANVPSRSRIARRI